MKTQIQISNLLSSFKSIYEFNRYKAVVNANNKTCFVYKIKDFASYIGEKNVSTSWKDCSLFDCPNHIKQEIQKAYEEFFNIKEEHQKQDIESDRSQDGQH